MIKLLFISFGGAIGALLRYYISGLTYNYFNSTFPWGTMFVNLLGALIIGFLWELFENIIVDVNYRAFVLIGLIGAFTTFSTFCLETFKLIEDGEIQFAVMNILVSNILGVVLIFLGIITSRYVINLFK